MRRRRAPWTRWRGAGQSSARGTGPLQPCRSGLLAIFEAADQRWLGHWRSWKAILRRAQVRDARVHDARHTAATLLIAQGVHIRVVQEVLGHTRVTTTERYTHVTTLQMKDASERTDRALWGQG